MENLFDGLQRRVVGRDGGGFLEMKVGLERIVKLPVEQAELKVGAEKIGIFFDNCF